MTPIMARLVLRRIRRAPLRSAALVLLFALASAVMATSMSLHRTAAGAWDRAHTATRGGHVQLVSFSAIDATRLREVPGVAAASGPFSASVLEARLDGRPAPIGLWALPPLAEIEVDRPAVVAGRWPSRADEVALEQTFARALGARPGSILQLAAGGQDRTLRVTGLAITTRTPPYPATAPGSAFVDARSGWDTGARPARGHLSQVSVRLDENAAPDEVTMRILRTLDRPDLMAITAASLRRDSLAAMRPIQVVLLSFGVLLTMAVLLLVGMLLSARLLEVARRIGQLRVVGLTTGQVVAVQTAEHTALALLGSLAGIAAALLASPAITAAVGETLGTTRVEVSPGPLIALALALAGVAGGAAALASARWARTPLTSVVKGAGLGQPRPSRLAATALRRGVSPVAVIGVKEAFARRMRAATLVLTVALAVMAGVAALAMEASFDRAERTAAASQPAGPDLLGLPPAGDDGRERTRLRVTVYGLEALLVAVAIGTLALTVSTSVRERGRELAVLRAMGFSPGQVVGSVSATHGLLAAGAAFIGVPLGIGFFHLAYGIADGAADEIGWPSPPGVVLVGMAAILLAGGVAASAARRGVTPLPELLAAD